MRVTPARVFAFLAVAAPIVVLVAARALLLATLEAEDGSTALAGLAVSILLLIASAFAFAFFGTVAAIAAQPGNAGEQSARSVALAVFGFLDLAIGGLALWALFNDWPLLWAGLPTLLVPFGVWAIYELGSDISEGEAVSSDGAPTPP